jgi:hypothetical protein
MRAILTFVVAVMTPIFTGVKYPVAGHSAGKEHFGISQQEAADSHSPSDTRDPSFPWRGR